MAQAGNHTGFWRSVMELPERTPLRVKLITAVLALVAIALLVISVAGISYMRDYLLNRADSQLRAAAASRAGSGYASHAPGTLGPQIGQRGLIEAIAPSGQAFPDPRFQLSTTDPKIPMSALWLAAHAGKPVTVAAKRGGDSWRVIVQPGQDVTLNDGQGFNGTVVVGLDVTDVYATVRQLEGFDILLSIGIMLILAVLATAAVRASLRPLTDIEETAGAIAAGDLGKRVPESDPRTEVGRLGRSLNVMLSQIESAFRSRSRSATAARRSEEKMRQFVADASHELRTPLTAIRGFAEYYRQRGGLAIPESETDSGQLTPADMDRIMRRVEQESARMGILVEDMLLLARLDQQRPLDARPVDLLTLAADAVHDARVVAPSRSINLTVSAGSALLVIGDEVRLRQVIGNLMSNALTHTPDGSPIEVLIRSGNLNEAPAATAMARPDRDDHLSSAEPGGAEPGSTEPGSAQLGSSPPEQMVWDAEHVPPPPAPHVPAAPPAPHPSESPAAPARSGPAAVIQVTDHGPGLTPEHAEHVFERFYRADPARRKGGTGLGLAIVAALIDAHGGVAWVQSRRGEGATFCIALPLAPEAVLGVEDEHDEEPDTDSTTDGNGDASDL